MLAATLVAALHTGPARRLARDRLVAWLAQEDVDARIESLEYDLLRLEVRAAGVRLAPRRAPDRPFFEAKGVRIDLPASVLRGRIAFEEIEVREGRVRLARGPDGWTNLPLPAHAAASPSREPLPLGRVRLEALDVFYEDEAVAVEARGLDLTLSPVAGGRARGRLHLPAWEARSGTLSLAGSGEGTIGFDGRALELSPFVLDGEAGRISIEGRLDLLGDRPALALRLEGDLDASRLASAAPAPVSPSGALHVVARVDGPIEAPRAEATVTGPALRIGSAPAALSLGLRHEAGVTRVRDLVLETLGGRLEASGETGWAPGRPGLLDVRANRVSAPRLLALAGLAPSPLLESTLDGEGALRWSGAPFGAVEGALVLSSRHAGAGTGIDGQVALILAGGRWSLVPRLRAGAGTLAGIVHGGLDPDPLRSTVAGTVSLEIDRLAEAGPLLQALGLDPPAWPTAGAARAELTLSGTVTAPVAETRLELEDVAGSGLGPLDGQAELTVSRKGLVLTRARLGVGASVLEASGTLSAAPPDVHLDVRGSVEATLLGPLVPPGWRPSSGRVGIEARLAGPLAAPRLEAAVELTDAEGEGWSIADARATVAADGAERRLTVTRLAGLVGGAAVRLVGPGHIRMGAATLEAEALTLASGGSTLSLDGALGRGAGALELVIEGDAADLPRVGLPEGSTLGGRYRLRLAASGALDRPRLEGRLAAEALTLTGPGGSEPAVLSLVATLDDGVVALESGRGEWQGAAVDASGRLPLRFLRERLPAALAEALPAGEGPARLEARLTGLTPRLLGTLTGAPVPRRAQGEAVASLRLEADAPRAEAVRGRLDVERAELDLQSTRIALVAPAAVVVEGGVARLSGFTWRGPFERDLTVSGEVDLRNGRPRPDLRVAGDADLRLADALLPVAAAGRLEVDLRYRAAGDAPLVLDGTVALSRGRFTVPDPEVEVTGLRGRLLLEGDGARLEGLEAAVNGGRVVAAGRIALSGDGESAFTVEGEGIGLELQPDLRGEVAFELQATGTAEAPRVTGHVEVVDAAYRGSRSPQQVWDDLLARWAPKPRATAVDDVPSALERSLVLDVAVRSRNDVTWDNAHGRFAATADLTLRGTPDRPALAGAVVLRPGGDLVVGGTVVDLRGGSLRFAEATGVDPRVAFSAYARVSRYDVELRAVGIAGDLELTLSSQPPLPQSDLLALIATGATSGETGSAQATAAREQALGTASRVSLGTLTEVIGVRGVRVTNVPISFLDDLNDNTRLTVSVQASRALELVHSQSLRQGGDTAQGMIWHPGRRLDVSVYAQSDDWFLEVQQRLDRGGARMGPAVRREPDPLVSAVTFRGAEGFDERTLRDRTRLRPGDRFDFYDWQAGEERLVRFFRDRGHREARVRGSRRAEADGRLALEYRVRPGPLTRVRIEGLEGFRGLAGDLEKAWRWAPSERLLLRDLQRAARLALARKGYVEAVVEPRVERPAEGVKEVVLRVEAGPRASRRAIVFAGREALGERELLEALAASGLGERVWVWRAAVERAIVERYVAHGYLAARVDASPPVVENGRGRLTVTIEEGPLFLISAVEVTAAPALRAVAEPPAIELARGTPYRPLAEAAAHLALERYYRRLGFNDATVEVTRRTETEPARVALAFSVDAGPRRLVEEVVLPEGAAVPAHVRASLEEREGGPANPEAWLPLQRELFGSGLYRDVDVTFEPAPGPAGAPAADGAVRPMRALVSLETWPSWRFGYGLRLSELTSLSGRSAWPSVLGVVERRNLFGRPITGRVEGLLDRQTSGVRGELNSARLFGRSVLTRLYLSQYRVRAEAEDFPDELDPLSDVVADTTELVAEQRWRRGRRELSYAYRLQHAVATLRGERLPGPTEAEQTIARPNLTGILDHRDSPLDARTGFFHSSNLEFGFAAVGSDVDFVRFLAKQYVYRTAEPFVLAGGVRVGLASGLSGVLSPVSDLRFTAGGGTTVRGYSEDSLSPVDSQGRRGGSGLLILNAEARFPIAWWVGGAVFVDAGQVREKASELSLSGLQYGLGLGLRLQTPVVVLRLDLGFPTPRRPGDAAYRLHFGIGQAF